MANCASRTGTWRPLSTSFLHFVFSLFEIAFIVPVVWFSCTLHIFQLTLWSSLLMLCPPQVYLFLNELIMWWQVTNQSLSLSHPGVWIGLISPISITPWRDLLSPLPVFPIFQIFQFFVTSWIKLNEGDPSSVGKGKFFFQNMIRAASEPVFARLCLIDYVAAAIFPPPFVHSFTCDDENHNPHMWLWPHVSSVFNFMQLRMPFQWIIPFFWMQISSALCICTASLCHSSGALNAIVPAMLSWPHRGLVLTDPTAGGVFFVSAENLTQLFFPESVQ